jgi:hypothetical protein
MTNKKTEKFVPQEETEIIPLDDHSNFLYSFDLGLATALITAGFSLVSLDRKNLHKSQFIFRRSDGMDEVVDAYWADNLEVKARKYFDTLKMLKNRLYSSE